MVVSRPCFFLQKLLQILKLFLGFPAVFTRVTSYLDWIEEVTSKSSKVFPINFYVMKLGLLIFIVIYIKPQKYL